MLLIDGTQLQPGTLDLSSLAIAGQWASILLADGSVPLSAAWDLGGFRITSTDPISDQELATKIYADTADDLRVKRDGTQILTADWDIGAGRHIISEDPSADQHLATKIYVDTAGALKVSADGTTSLTANWDTGGVFTILAPDPSAAQQVATKAYVDLIGGGTLFVKRDGTLTLTAHWTSGKNIRVLDPVVALDAVNLQYLSAELADYLTEGDGDILYVRRDGTSILTGDWNVGDQEITNIARLGVNVTTPTYSLEVDRESTSANIVKFSSVNSSSMEAKWTLTQISNFVASAATMTGSYTEVVQTNVLFEREVATSATALANESITASLYTLYVQTASTFNGRIEITPTSSSLQVNNGTDSVSAGCTTTAWTTINTISAVISQMLFDDDSFWIARGATTTLWADTLNYMVGIKMTNPEYELDINGNARIVGANKLWFGGTSGTANGEVNLYRLTTACATPARLATDSAFVILSTDVLTSGGCSETCAALRVVGDIQSEGKMWADGFRCCVGGASGGGFIASDGYYGIDTVRTFPGTASLTFKDGLLVGFS